MRKKSGKRGELRDPTEGCASSELHFSYSVPTCLSHSETSHMHGVAASDIFIRLHPAFSLYVLAVLVKRSHI